MELAGKGDVSVRLDIILLTVGLVIDQSNWHTKISSKLLTVLIDIIGTGVMNDDMRWLQATIPRPGLTRHAREADFIVALVHIKIETDFVELLHQLVTGGK